MPPKKSTKVSKRPKRKQSDMGDEDESNNAIENFAQIAEIMEAKRMRKTSERAQKIATLCRSSLADATQRFHNIFESAQNRVNAALNGIDIEMSQYISSHHQRAIHLENWVEINSDIDKTALLSLVNIHCSHMEKNETILPAVGEAITIMKRKRRSILKCHQKGIKNLIKSSNEGFSCILDSRPLTKSFEMIRKHLES